MFCKLDQDQKTFEYCKKYIHLWQDNHDQNFGSLDSRIQYDEISWHLNQCNCEGTDERNQEVFHWLDHNAQEFRSYLNSIKLVFTVYHCSGKDWDDITWEEFSSIRNKLNEIKKVCLDTILVENYAVSRQY